MKKDKLYQGYDQGKGWFFTLQFLLLCLCGQLCWNIENQWFNTFVYAKIGKYVWIVTGMVICSATLTCISTFIFGAMSDRKGRRKNMMGIGYIAWGLSTILVGLIEFIRPAVSIYMAGTLMIVLDGIMSFIGSVGYDSCFNSWANDHTTTANKGFVGLILGIMPVIATIAGTLAGGLIIDSGKGDNYQALFLAIGGFVILCGVLSLIFTKDNPNLKPQSEGSLMHQATASFRFKELRSIPNMKEMILACLVICVYFISFNFYFVHIANWAIYFLNLSASTFAVFEGAGMILGIVVAIPITKLIDKDRIPLVCFLGLLVSYVGLMIVYLFIKGPADVSATALFGNKNALLILGCFFFGTGDILMTEACMIWVRGLFPETRRGQFEGIRCIFFVWVPMLIGTLCGDAIIRTFSQNMTDEAGVPIQVPTSDLYFYASFVVLLAFIPLFFAARVYKKRIKARNEALAKGIVDPTLFDAIPTDENKL